MQKFSEIPNAQKRSLSIQERFSFFLFIGKLILSKFGLVFVFVVLHLSSRYSESLVFTRCAGRSSAGVLGSSYIAETKHSEKFNLLNDKKTEDNFLQEKTSLKSFTKGNILNDKVFQKIRTYCIIGTIVTLFLNPQQTKYFGGLAVVLKQAGFFTKYSKSEKTVYVFSWIFVILFFCFSIQIARAEGIRLHVGLH